VFQCSNCVREVK